MARLAAIWPQLGGFAPIVAEQIEIDAQYDTYLERQEADIVAFRRDEGLSLPADLDYSQITGLSTEARQKLASGRTRDAGTGCPAGGHYPGGADHPAGACQKAAFAAGRLSHAPFSCPSLICPPMRRIWASAISAGIWPFRRHYGPNGSLCGAFTENGSPASI